MTFFKLLQYDIKNGLVKEYKKYAACAALFLLFCLCFLFTKGREIETLTCGDFLFFITGGMDRYIRAPGNAFLFPSLWMLFMLIPFYIILYYPLSDLTGYGKNVLIQSGSRVQWWLSKCIWCIVSITLYFILLWFILVAFCAITGFSLSLSISKELLSLLISEPSPIVTAGKEKMVFNGVLIVQILVMPILVSAALGILQMTLSLFIKPFFSFSIVAGILVASSYYLSPWMIGNYAMAQRNRILTDDGVSTNFGILFCLILLLASVGLGAMVFKRYDILNKE